MARVSDPEAPQVQLFRSRLKQWAGAALAVSMLLAIGSGLAAMGNVRGEPSEQITLRRLTRSEYRQSVSDIFGSDIAITAHLDPDMRRENLIAIGAANATIGSSAFEQYDAAAREIAGQVIDDRHRATLIECSPANAALPDDTCARAFLERTGLLLYRRPLDAAETSHFVDLARAAANVRHDFFGGLAVSLATMLESPPFLFRTERSVLVRGNYQLDDYSIASRLSFLLWNAPPDAALLAVAGRGVLSTEAGRRAQVERMLASPRVEKGVRAFFTDMLALDELDGLQKDPAIYPRFSDRLARDAREQTLRTIVDITLRRNQDYRTLFTTRHTFQSRALGLLYGEPVTSPDGWEAKDFAPGDPRVGILTQPAFLMAHSHPGRSSPTLRGKAVRELLLCQNVPAPPPNVNFALVQNIHDPRFATARQRIAAHNTEPMCAACHKMMDPLGLPLENFDGAAGLRPTENGASLDLSGELGGNTFVGAAGLGTALAKDPALSSCLIERIYAYGSGRTADGPISTWLDGVRDHADASGMKIRDLLRTIALDDRFYRMPTPALSSPASTTQAEHVHPEEPRNGA